ncbi:lantibiotic dehydratase [Bacillus fungorum]|uniref:Lantibiotic biosynthesis protein n=1 Tax=Bacillus fungorum TaxID=2039284 RepID=A0A2G6QB31_9BACI|nr:lantibiotic dehydratase [Bacillus fungorum]PIE93639.1 hypothetical protein CO726_19690 [Bacillus fungorum]
METKSDLSYTCLDFFMYRSPILSLDFYRSIFCNDEISLEEIVNNPVLREIIAVSSPDLLNSIINLKKETKNKKRKQLLRSCISYIIRSSTRATPYGLCAGVNIGKFSDVGYIDNKPLIAHKKNTRPDMEWLLNIVKQIEMEEGCLDNLNVIQNKAIYYSGNHVKIPYYTFWGQENTDAKYNREHVSIELTSVVKKILEVTVDPINYRKLKNLLYEFFPKKSPAYLNQVINHVFNSELLISSLRPPILNIHPFEYVLNQLAMSPRFKQWYGYLLSIYSEIKKYDNQIIGTGEQQYLFVTDKMCEKFNLSNPLQVDLTVNHSVVLPEKMKQEVENAAQIFWSLTGTKHQLKHLDEYKKKFISLYGTKKEIPILELLDDAIGLGVPATYSYPESYRSIESYKSNNSSTKLIYSLLAKALNDGDSEIVINEEHKSLLEKEITGNDLPLSMEMYFTLGAQSEEELNKGNYRLIIGANKGSLGAGKTFGRFMHIFNNDNKQKIREISEMEQNLCPNSLFAELAFSPSNANKINVILTENIRNFEIPISTLSSKKDEQTIPLSDIVVGCTLESFYLKSKSLNKEIIPTVNHRLNFNKEPNVYRFMREITIGRHKNWSHFQWGELENFPFLPRLRYGRIVISPAKWTLTKFSLQAKNAWEKEEWIDLFKVWKEKWSVPRYVFLTNRDNRILLDLNNHVHIDILFDKYRRLQDEQNLHLVEVGFEIEKQISENQKEIYLHEFVFPLIKAKTNSQEFFKLPSINNKLKNQNTPISYFPGGPWLYLKLYGMNQRLNEFLGNHLQTICKLGLQSGWTSKFFYMQFLDPQPHIRLRFYSDHHNNLYSQGMKELYNWAQMMKDKGLLSHVVVDTYIPEVERYGGKELLSYAEAVFFQDSRYMMRVKEYLMESDKYGLNEEIIGVLNVIEILNSFKLSFEKQLIWLNDRVNYKDHLGEFREHAPLLISLYTDNKSNPVCQDNLLSKIAIKRTETIIQYSEAIDNAYKAALLHNDKDNIISSVIHMSLNRLIGTDREKERKIITLARHLLKNRQFSYTNS